MDAVFQVEAIANVTVNGKSSQETISLNIQASVLISASDLLEAASRETCIRARCPEMGKGSGVVETSCELQQIIKIERLAKIHATVNQHARKA